MNALNRIVFSVLVLLGLTSCDSGQQSDKQMKGFDTGVYFYQKVGDTHVNLTVHYFDIQKAVLYTDLVVSEEVQEGPGNDIYLIVGELGFEFYLPQNWSSKRRNWEHRKCEYQVIGEDFYSIRGDDQNCYLIEGKCGNLKSVARYYYSRAYGLQNFALGSYVDHGGRKVFQIEKAFALAFQEIGFGAVLSD